MIDVKFSQRKRPNGSPGLPVMSWKSWQIAKTQNTTLEDSDEDYQPPEAPEASTTGPMLRRRMSTDTEPVSARKSARKSLSDSPNTKTRLPVDLRSVVASKKHITKLLKAEDYDRNLSLRVLRASLQLQKDYLQRKAKVSAKQRAAVPKPAIRDTVCNLLGISQHTYGKIISKYMNNWRVYVSGSEGGGRGRNTEAKLTRIPRTKEVRNAVHEFVHEHRMKKQRRLSDWQKPWATR